MLSEVGKGEVVGVRRRGDGDLDNAGLILAIKAAMGRVHALIRNREGLHDLKKVRQT